VIKHERENAKDHRFEYINIFVRLLRVCKRDDCSVTCSSEITSLSRFSRLPSFLLSLNVTLEGSEAKRSNEDLLEEATDAARLFTLMA